MAPIYEVQGARRMLKGTGHRVQGSRCRAKGRKGFKAGMQDLKRLMTYGAGLKALGTGMYHLISPLTFSL